MKTGFACDGGRTTIHPRGLRQREKADLVGDGIDEGAWVTSVFMAVAVNLSRVELCRSVTSSK